MRKALRSLRRSPATALGVTATLGLALGASTAIASLLYGVFVDSLPGTRPRELVRVFCEAHDKKLQDVPLSIAKFEVLRAQQSVFTGVAADFAATFAITGLGEPAQVRGFKVTSNYFDVLGIKPVRGRTFRREEESGGTPVAIVSHELWVGTLESDLNAVGRALTLNGIPHTIIGVLPPQPHGWFGQADVWTTHPFDNPNYPRPLLDRGVSFLRVVARRAPTASTAQLDAVLEAIGAHYRADHSDNADASWLMRARTIEDEAVGSLRPALRALLAAAGLVLMVAASNASNLMAVRFLGRTRELAVRRALGASRAQVLRPLLVDGILLGLLGGVLGLALAWLVLRASRYLAAGALMLTPGLAVSGRVASLGVAVAAFCGLLAAVIPAFRLASRCETASTAQRSAGPEQSETRERSLLLTLQVALSFALLAGALLLTRSLSQLLRTPVGFDARNVSTGSVSLPPARYADGAAQAQFAERWLERLIETPGIETAALAQGLALTGHDRSSPYARADRDVPPLKDRPLGLVRSVTPRYFETLGIPLLAGRDFSAADRAGSAQTVIISRGAASTLFPEGQALGHRLLLSSEGGGLEVQVVGVVGDVRSLSPELENALEFYRPLAQRPSPYLQVAVRSWGEPAEQALNLRKTLREVDPQLPLTAVAPMTAVLAGTLTRRLALTTLIAAFAALALLLACVGIGSVLANMVERRTAEIGIRLALGAPQRTVRSMILRGALRPVGWGLAAGAPALGLFAPLLRTQLYETRVWDPMTLAGSGSVLFVTACLACWFPARRAVRINPADCLRNDRA